MSGKIIITLSAMDLARLSDLLVRGMRQSVYFDTKTAQADMCLANKLNLLMSEMAAYNIRTLAISFKEPVMEKKPEAKKEKQFLPGWVEDSIDEHRMYYDPHDPISTDEVCFMLRELESSDLDNPNEFLRRCNGD